LNLFTATSLPRYSPSYTFEYVPLPNRLSLSNVTVSGLSYVFKETVPSVDLPVVNREFPIVLP
jgi:hypothetical protein